jgi:hypothetical protein
MRSSLDDPVAIPIDVFSRFVRLKTRPGVSGLVPVLFADFLRALDIYKLEEWANVNWNCCSSVCRNTRAAAANWNDPTRHREPESAERRLPGAGPGY